MLPPLREAQLLKKPQESTYIVDVSFTYCAEWSLYWSHGLLATYQFGYYLQKADHHSVLIKVRDDRDA
jgi:hypothetical protein